MTIDPNVLPLGAEVSTSDEHAPAGTFGGPFDFGIKRLVAAAQEVFDQLKNGTMGVAITASDFTLGPFPKLGIEEFALPIKGTLHIRFEK